jgi:nicotinate-nucleotide pyrophosphorylase (carboxylating)
MDNPWLSPSVDRLIDLALEEDIGTGDVTTRALIPPDLQGEAHIRAKAHLVVAGLPVAARVFQKLDAGLNFAPQAAEGQEVEPGTVLAVVTGPAAPILTGERVALNFLMRLSGIATFTRDMVQQLPRGSQAVLTDTRKTTPGWRLLEKYAVRLGGARNHRLGLFDAVLIKNNHLAAVGSITAAVRRAREQAPGLAIEVEVTDLAGLQEALKAGADVIMLDNMDEAAMARAVEITGGRAILEASGGMTAARLPQVSATGVNLISMGALTHSAPAADIHLRLVRVWR